MSDTTFVNQTTIIVADWLNDVNDAVYHGIGDGTNAPTTPSEVRDNLNVPERDGTGATGNWPINAATATVATSALGFSGTVAIANGGTGQVNATAAFDALKQAATDAYSGVVEKATDAEVQAGTDTTRYVTPAGLKAGQIVSGSAITLTNQSFVDFTGIPSWAKKITAMFFNVSTNGSSGFGLQLGDSGGVETTGYSGGYSQAVNAGATIGASISNLVGLSSSNASNIYYGTITFTKVSGNNWLGSGVLALSNGAVSYQVAGGKTLSDTLDRVRFVTANGTDQFDLGTINILWE